MKCQSCETPLHIRALDTGWLVCEIVTIDEKPLPMEHAPVRCAQVQQAKRATGWVRPPRPGPKWPPVARGGEGT